MRRILRSDIKEGGRHVSSPESENYIDYGGWKIHLSVDPKNYEKVDRWLDKNHPGQYKLLGGGDRGDSDFTIYIGNKDDMNKFTHKMSMEINHLLEPIHRSTDINLTDRIAARYDPRGRINKHYQGKPGFIDKSTGGPYYGHKGIPYDRFAADIRSQIQYASPKDKSGWEKILIEHEEEIKKDLAKKYGIRYTGVESPSESRNKKKVATKLQRKSIKKTIKKKTCACVKKR